MYHIKVLILHDIWMLEGNKTRIDNLLAMSYSYNSKLTVNFIF